MRYAIVSEYTGFNWIVEECDRYFDLPQSASDIDKFQAAVNMLLDHGWELAGGV